MRRLIKEANRGFNHGMLDEHMLELAEFLCRRLNYSEQVRQKRANIELCRATLRRQEASLDNEILALQVNCPHLEVVTGDPHSTCSICKAEIVE